MHDDLRRRLRDEVDAELGSRPPRDLTGVLTRGRSKRLALRLVTTMSIVLVGTALVAGGLSIARSLSSDDAAPVRPAEEENQANEPMRHGRILNADSGYWQGSTAPPPPGGRHSYTWDAFDQDTGSFLYAAHEGAQPASIDGRVWVVGEDGPVAEFDCPPPSACGADQMETFGPGPDEVTVPSTDALRGYVKESNSRSAYIIGFDGRVRDTLDISAVFSQGHLSDLAWSPDGNRLAVSTERYGRVWIFDRDGGEPHLVYTDRATGFTVLRDLAWSPDGNTLALLVAPPGSGCSEVPERAARPRLVALRVAPDEAVRAETLNIYDDWVNGCALPHHFHIAFPFAWSPDGTRIAVTKGGGIVEISAENGDVLARHSGEGLEGVQGLSPEGEEIVIPNGPLVWLPKR